VAIVAPIALPSVNSQNAGDLFGANQLPSWSHLLGTDTLGRDVLSRLLVGDRVTLVGVVEALVVILVLGVPLGLAAGYLGGWTDRVVTWLADLTFSLPAVVIIIVVLSVFPASMLAGMVTFGVIAAPGLMRVVRSATLPIREELYIKAAEASGLSRIYILTRHILPRIAGVVIVQASLLAAVALGVQTGLAFLRLLVADPAPSWGGMVADGTSVLLLHPWLIIPPGVAIAVTMLALSLLGDSVRDTAVESWSAPGPAKRASVKAAPASAETTPPAGAQLLTVHQLPEPQAGPARRGGRHLRRRRRRDRRDRRRVGVRQERHGRRHHRPAPWIGADRRREHLVRGKGPRPGERVRAPQAPRAEDRLRFPGADGEPRPGLSRRLPDRRGPPPPP